MIGTGVVMFFIGDTGFTGLSMLVGSLTFRIHELEIVVQGNCIGSEYGVEHVVDRCSTDVPVYPGPHATVLSSVVSMQVIGIGVQLLDTVAH